MSRRAEKICTLKFRRICQNLWEPPEASEKLWGPPKTLNSPPNTRKPSTYFQRNFGSPPAPRPRPGLGVLIWPPGRSRGASGPIAISRESSRCDGEAPGSLAPRPSPLSSTFMCCFFWRGIISLGPVLRLGSGFGGRGARRQHGLQGPEKKNTRNLRRSKIAEQSKESTNIDFFYNFVSDA